MADQINIALLGSKFMGRAHSNAWSKVASFFDVDLAPVLHTVVGRNAEELAAFARVAAELDVAAVHACQRTAQGESDATSRLHAVGPSEAFEHLLLQIGIDADPVVLHADQKLTIDGGSSELDEALGLRELHRVRDQVLEQPFQQPRPAVHVGQVRLRRDRQPDRTRFRVTAEMPLDVDGQRRRRADRPKTRPIRSTR